MYGYFSRTIFVLVLHLTTYLSVSKSAREERKILHQLEINLPKYSAPLDLVNNTVFIFADLFQILDVDEKNGSWLVKLWTFFYYVTPSAKWNVSEHGGIRNLVVPSNTFWNPDIGTFNFHVLNNSSSRFITRPPLPINVVDLVRLFL